jgi:hypothetical protein
MTKYSADDYDHVINGKYTYINPELKEVMFEFIRRVGKVPEFDLLRHFDRIMENRDIDVRNIRDWIVYVTRSRRGKYETSKTADYLVHEFMRMSKDEAYRWSVRDLFKERKS